MTWTEPPSIVSEYYLSRVYGKSFLMFEGETDEDTWGKFIADQYCHTHPLPRGEGKDQIMSALKIRLCGESGVAGLVDSDYWLITNSDELETENLLYDHCYPDSELILFNSPALTDIFKGFFDTPDILEMDDFARALRDEAHRLASEFGYFRLLNHVEDYGLKFKDIDHTELLDALEFDRDWFARRLTDEKHWISKDELLKQVDELREKCSPDNVQLCQGHDTIAITVYLLPKLFKAEFGEDLPEAANEALEAINNVELPRRLRIAYKYGYFKETSLFSSIRKWESANCPYRILKAEI